MTATTETTYPPCPPWCALPAGHPYFPEPPAWECIRFHGSTPDGAGDVELSQVENVVDGVVSLGSIELIIFTDHGTTALTLEHARALVEQIPAVADQLERLTS